MSGVCEHSRRFGTSQAANRTGVSSPSSRRTGANAPTPAATFWRAAAAEAGSGAAGGEAAAVAVFRIHETFDARFVVNDPERVGHVILTMYSELFVTRNFVQHSQSLAIPIS